MGNIHAKAQHCASFLKKTRCRNRLARLASALKVNKEAIRRWCIIGVAVGALAAIVCTGLAFHYKDLWVPAYVEYRDLSVNWLKQIPAPLFFLLLATVPIVPIPMSIFYISTGIYPTPVALLGILIAVPTNLALTYWLVRTLMKPLALRILGRMGLEIPKARTKKGEVMFSVLIRVCGMPYTPQNYILSLSHIPFRTYMMVGVPLQVAPAIAMMLLGDSLMHGEGKKAFIALGIIVALGVATKLTKDYLQKRRACRAELGEDAAQS